MPTRKNEARWIESRQRWQINVQNDGERKTFTSATIGPKGKITAEKAADKWLESKHTKDVRFNVLWDRFLEVYKKSYGTSGYKNHESIGRIWLLPKVGHRKISHITNAHWQECILDAYEAGRSKKHLKNIRASITAVYAYAFDCRAPMDAPRVKIPKDAPEKEKVILQPDDIMTLFTQDTFMLYKKPHPCFFIHAWRFYIVTGLRRGELVGLQKEDLQGSILYIRRSVNKFREITAGKTKKAVRYFIIGPQQQAILDAQAEMLKKAGIVSKWLFPGENGDVANPNTIYDRWSTYRNQHGISSSIHDMRHTLISISKADVPEQLLKKMVGHTASMDTFGVYGHDVDGEMKRASKLLDKTIGKILKTKPVKAVRSNAKKK